MSQTERPATGLGWLMIGMLAGLGLALFSLLSTGGGAALPDNAIAKVNDRYISRDDYARALAAVVTDSEQALNIEQRRRVLERLIDEALLLQYGQDQGLVYSDRRVRASLVSAVLEAKSAAAETQAIDQQSARDFYQQHRVYFSRPAQLQVSLLRFKDAAVAAEMRDRLPNRLVENEDFERLDHIPAALLPIAKLRQLMGASLTEAASQLNAGEVSAVIMLNDRAHLIRVEQRRESAPAFDDIVEQVEAEMRRRQAEQAVRKTLTQLREAQDVVIVESRL